NWNDYRAELRSQIQDDILRQRFVEDRITISDSDIDAFLSMNAGQPMAAPPAAVPAPQAEPEPAPAPAGPELVELAQILIEVPDYAANSVVEEKRKQAEAILRKLKSGADFAGVAAASSNGPQALEGGNMGIRPLHDWPYLFARAIENTPPGGISGIVQSGRGFHILKVLRRGYAQRPAPRAARPDAGQNAQAQAAAAPRAPAPTGPMMVTQTHARHILIKTSKVVDDDKARAILEGLRNRIEHGESFAELAKRYSEDASAPQGGDLGWLNPGETVPAFEQAMNALQDGQVSQPVKSPFGWHLIQVEGRQTKNMEQEFRRMQARSALMQRRIGPADAARPISTTAWKRRRPAVADMAHRKTPGHSRGGGETQSRTGGAHQARKRFGQHFLADESVVDAIVRAIDPQPGDAMVEIGPGLS